MFSRAALSNAEKPTISLAIEKLLRSTDGSITVEGVQFDPNNLEADVDAFQRLLDGTGAATSPAPSKPFNDAESDW